MVDLGPNAALLGRSADDFLAEAATPALCLDLDVMQANLDAMQALATRHGKALRPHMKAHKSSRIAELQRAAGAIGISCATAREAELASRAGLGGILITTPIVTPLVLARLAALRADFTFAVDSSEGIDRLARSGMSAGVVIDINVGQNRTGVATPEAAFRLARQVAAAPNLNLRGIQAYYGHLQHIPNLVARRDRITAQFSLIAAVSAALAKAGMPPQIVTGGGTGTHVVDLAEGPFTEIQPGSYLFMDSQYGAVDLGDASPFGVSLSLLARVTSAAIAGQVVIDAGTKAMSTDTAAMRLLTPGLDGAAHRFMGDEHSALAFPASTALPAIGAAIRLMTTHCDPTVNLHDRYHVLSGGKLADIWPIEARGY